MHWCLTRSNGIRFRLAAGQGSRSLAKTIKASPWSPNAENSEELLRVPKQVFKPVGIGLEIKSTQSHCDVMSTALLSHSTREGMRGRRHIVRDLKVDDTSWAEKQPFRGKLSSRSTVGVRNKPNISIGYHAQPRATVKSCKGGSPANLIPRPPECSHMKKTQISAKTEPKQHHGLGI